MPFIPHSDADVAAMLATLGVDDIEALFDEIPAHLQHGISAAIPPALSEFELTQLMQARADADDGLACYAGAGAYEHHIPAAVWQLVPRGEFYTAYTPYQAEASQGTLQLLYEYQSLMTALTDMEVSNASLYDGATSLAEAILMAVRVQRKQKQHTILLPDTVHPAYRQVVTTIVKQQGMQIQAVPFCTESGRCLLETMAEVAPDELTAVVIPQPNFFGVLEDVHAMSDWAKQKGALVIALVNPLSLAILRPPGQWGEAGADIVCGEAQPLGIPLASGGPYLGFMTCKKSLIRQLPGRLVGRTVDSKGRPGFALTLQAREQHIRRAKATSNICTNQGLLVTAATLYLSLMGGAGLQQAASHSHANSMALRQRLAAVSGLSIRFLSPFFHESVFQFDKPVPEVQAALAQRGYLAGVPLEPYFPSLPNTLMFCVTETKTQDDINAFCQAMQEVLS